MGILSISGTCASCMLHNFVHTCRQSGKLLMGYENWRAQGTVNAMDCTFDIKKSSEVMTVSNVHGSLTEGLIDDITKRFLGFSEGRFAKSLPFTLDSSSTIEL